MIIGGNNVDAINTFRKYLQTCFNIKDLGQLKYFLGIEVGRGGDGVFISQRKYALDIISECGLLAAKPSSFPLEQHHQLTLVDGLVMADPEQY